MFRTLLISICIICSAVSADTPVYEDFKLLASDGASEDQFGNSVSISNDGTSVIVGTAQWCCSNTGAAYIYEHIDGAWQETKLLASDGASGDYFGQSVSISGDGTTAIVGAYSNDSNADASGSAYIYKLVKGVWQETKLLASDGASGDYFGNSVSISNDGTSVIVGAYYDDDNSGFGSAYIYRFNGSSWIETKLVASDGASDDYFGHSVSISSDGTTAIVGSYNDDDHGTGSGSAYIYRFNGSSWIETKLLASDGEAEDKFGWSVAASGDTVIVGAYWNTDNWSTSGSAYIYELVGGVWQETILLASDGEGFPGFGHSVSIASDGTSVIVGSYNHLEEGTAYIYNFDGTNWVEETILLASDGAYGDRFGFGVSISGDATTAIVGAYYDDDNGDNSGSAYVYELVESDSDGDGVPDNIDNCYLYNPDQADCNENGIGDICDVADSTSFDCDQNNVPDECQPDCDGDGWIDACDSEGDCDDDGIPDNCEADCNGNSIPDDCDIIYGISEDCNENGIPDECDIADGTEEDCNGNDIPDSCDITDGTEEDCNENDVPDTCEFEESFQETTILIASDGDYSFGNSVSISSDGTTAIVGANGKASGNYGSAYIYSLVKGVWEETKLLPSDGGYGNFGYSVSISSNGTTAIVGAFEDNSNGLYSGSAYIFELVKGVWQETKLMASDGAGGDRFGNSVSISGDGTTAIVGAYYDDDNDYNSGSAYIYELVSGVWQEETKLLASDGAEWDRFGTCVAISGDTVVVGADGDGGNYGSAYIYSLVKGVWEETKLLPSDGGSFGYSVSISGDGTTVIVGATGTPGIAYIYKLVSGVWEETKLLASDWASGDRFGYSVSISSDGTTAIVGAYYDDDNGVDSGSAYIYRFDGINWIEETKLLASDGGIGDGFGESVCLSGDGTTALVGARDPWYAYMFTISYPWDTDCNENGQIDFCEIEEDPSLDCDEDGLLDSCAIDSGFSDDCNSNGIPDECDLEDPANDQNNNGVLDECECVGDADLDGYVNVNDLLIIIGYWGNNTPQADLNFDGIVDVTDLLIVVGNWGPCE